MNGIIRISAATVIGVCLCGRSYCQGTFISVPSTPDAGVVPNALPFTDTFDQYPVAFYFGPPSNGWVQAIGDVSHVVPVTELLSVPGDASLFSGKHLRLDTEGQTLFNVTTGLAQNVWIDMSVLMVPSEDVPWVVPCTQLGLFLDSDNRFSAYCGLTNVFVSSGIQFATWGQKSRLTLQLAYEGKLSVPFFRVYIDQVAVQWSQGYRLPDVAAASGGEWLPCATTNRTFCGVGFRGVADIDALKFSTSSLETNAPAQVGIGLAVAVSWLADYGRRYQVETCDNLASNAWRSFGGQILGDGTTNSVYDALGAVNRKFYRVTAVE